MFENALWESRSHGSKYWECLLLIPLGMILAALFIAQKYGFGATPISLIVIGFVILIAMIPFLYKLKWHKPDNIFAFTEEGIIFTKKNNNSCFQDDYENIANYNIKLTKKGRANVRINFKVPSNAGALGNLKYLEMIEIDDYERLIEILNEHGIEEQITIAQK